MQFNASRLTLYALLSAIETDLRFAVASHLSGQRSHREIFGERVHDVAFQRMISDSTILPEQASLEQFLVFVDFGDTLHALNRHRSLLPKEIASYVKGVTPRLEKLVPIRNRIAHSRPLLFDDLSTTLDSANHLLTTRETFWTELGGVLRRLERDPSFVLGLKIPTFAVEDNQSNHNLPTPDFDETGFLGREKKLEDLKRACLGPFPVISIVGEGGLGKTALALKVAYEMLDLEGTPFDAVVWSSSKTSQLTPNEVVDIEYAIRDSLGIFTDIADYLVGSTYANAMDEILSYLSEFRILLIIDNLETVLDDRIRSFLGQLPAGSKVLLTSRIGLGELEYRVKLEPMDNDESVQLLRAIVKARGVEGIVRASNERLAQYCNQMQNNPGFIKWFVSAVQVGLRPEDVLARRALFLEYCMSNVYNYLSEGGKQVIQSMLCVPGPHNQAELAFLNKMEVDDLQRSLYELQRTNMASMTSVPVGSTFETKYELSELARDYIYQHHPADNETYKIFQKRNRQLKALSEQLSASQDEGRFYYRHLTTRSKSDAVAAKYLLDAHKHISRKQLSDAELLVTKARSLAPDYFEVRRISAYLKAAQGNPVLAKQEFEAAIDLNPKDAALRYHFGEFLIRNLEDTEEALKQFEEGGKLDPVSLELQLGLARSNLYLKNFKEARRIIDELFKRPVIMQFGNKAIYDLHLQIYHRQAEHFLSLRLPMQALDQLDKFKDAYEACPTSLLDIRMKDQIRKAMPTARSCAEQLSDNAMQATARYLIDWLAFQTNPTAPNKFNKAMTGDLHGTISRLVKDKGFGFIVSNDDRSFFFHKSDVSPTEVWFTLNVGDRVEFSPSEGARGPVAKQILVYS